MHIQLLLKKYLLLFFLVVCGLQVIGAWHYYATFSNYMWAQFCQIIYITYIITYIITDNFDIRVGWFLEEGWDFV